MVKFVATALACAKLAIAACPYMDGDASTEVTHHAPSRRDGVANSGSTSTDEFLAQFEIDDSNTYLTSNTGGPIEDQESLSAGERGPTLLEDFVFREKIMHFGKLEFSSQPCSANKWYRS
jgi:catalase